MPEFLVERVMPGVSKLSIDDLKQTSRLGYATLLKDFPSIDWLQSYATDDTLYCVYRAPSEEVIQEYARHSILPVHKISEVRVTLDPTSLGNADQDTAALRRNS